MDNTNRSLLAPVYVEGRRVQFWYVDYDPATDSARPGYQGVGMPDQDSRERLAKSGIRSRRLARYRTRRYGNWRVSAWLRCARRRAEKWQ